jgi:DNA invertase Pin-like site-specific DNA recombinase
MANGKFVAYHRVSTAQQGTSGLGLDAQKEAVRSYLDGGRWKMVDEVTEIESGKRNDRPALARALSLCRLHKATLIIAKLDRLARNVNFISNLMESTVEFTAVDFPTANRLTVHILAAVAEHEAQMISTRTKDALRAARARGVKLGTRNPMLIARYAEKGSRASAIARATLARVRAADILPVINTLQADGVTTLWRIAETLNERGIPAPRGGSWSPMQVSRVIALS